MVGVCVFFASAVVLLPVWLLEGGGFWPPSRAASELIPVAATLWGRHEDLGSFAFSACWNPSLNLKGQPAVLLFDLITHPSPSHRVFVFKNGLSPKHEDPQHPEKYWVSDPMIGTVMKTINWCFFYQLTSLYSAEKGGVGIRCLASRV